MGYRNYGPANGVTVNKNGQGDYLTLTAALAAVSSGQTVYLYDGTYTENVTLPAGITLTSFGGAELNPNVIINGSVTMSAAGTSTISNICLQTNSTYALIVSGSSASILYVKNCYLNLSNNTGINYTSSSGSSAVNLIDCTGNIGTTGITLYSMSSIGALGISYSHIGNLGSSTTASSNSAGVVYCVWSSFNIAFSTSSAGIVNFNWCYIVVDQFNITCVTTAGTGTATIEKCSLRSGTASALSAGTGTTISCFGNDFTSSNTNAITGLGTVQISEVEFIGSSALINTSSVNRLTTQTGYLQSYNLGVGTSPGSTAGITFDGSNFLNNYATSTWTPTMVGASTAGVTTYSVQTGYYTRIGNLVWCTFVVIGSAATGTGIIVFGGLPFTIKNENPIGTLLSANSWTWPVGGTSLTLQGVGNTTTMLPYTSGTATAGALVQIANAAFNFQGTIVYQI